MRKIKKSVTEYYNVLIGMSRNFSFQTRLKIALKIIFRK